MEHSYWYKQNREPLFPDILWSRPESKHGAGKLAIIGGNAHGFGAAGTAFSAAEEAGAGAVYFLLPDAIQKIARHMLPDAVFAPSTPSGSFSRKALSAMFDLTASSDCVLLAGDFGRNSETAMTLEEFVHRKSGPLVITHDAVDYFKMLPLPLVDRQYTVIALSMSQLQKVFIHTPTITPIVMSMTTVQLAEALHTYTATHPACVITKHHDLIFVAHEGKVSTTLYSERIWRIKTATYASVFYMQNPQSLFESVTTAVYELAKAPHVGDNLQNNR